MKEKNVIRTIRYESPCGTLVLGSMDGALCLCDWSVEPHHGRVAYRLCRVLDARLVEGATAVTDRAARQLDEYFAGKRQGFDLPLLFAGTDFQQRVWRSLLAIPFGQTVSYAEQARRLGMPRAVRAVANANGANALSVFVPCHRVVGSNHRLTGYAGGLAAKEYLLRLEQNS